MKIIRIGLAAALALVVMAPATMVAAAKKPAAAVAGAIDPKYREKGMADTPALVTAAGLNCSVADAVWIGEDKKTGQSFYEVACNPGLGGVDGIAVLGPKQLVILSGQQILTATMP